MERSASAKKGTVPFFRDGFALVVVLLVLAALIALATPFLLSMRNESRATGGRVDQARARAAALGAREHARRALAETYSAKDTTPLFDDEDELQPPPIPKDFFPASDPHGEIWSAQVEDEQGKVNCNSASPYVFARLFGYTTITKDLGTEEAEIPVVSTDGFPAEGFLWVRGELIRYLGKSSNAFLQCQRGFLAESKRFLEPQKHPESAPVLDDRVCALARWRMQEGASYRVYDTLLSLPRAGEASVAGSLPQEFFDPQMPLCTVYSSRHGAGSWGAASRVIVPAVAGETRDLVVANSRFIAEGATLRIWGKDGKVEYALVVQSNPAGGQVKLAAPLLHNYDAFEAQVAPLLRHPVNANTARPDLLVRLLANLRLRQRTAGDFVTPEEAGEVVRRLVAARPILGFEDFVQRVLRPALEDQAISPLDAQAIYRNALHGDDGGLAMPSMPFSFASGDVYQISSGASINTPLGAERARAMLREVLTVAPQEPLVRVLGTQQDFEEQMRLTRESRFWVTGPENTSIEDGGTNPPSRDVGQIQESAYQEKYFASDDFTVSWAASQPARKMQAGAQGRFLHFDYAWNPDAPFVGADHWKGNPETGPASLAATGGLLFPGAIEAWFKPKTWAGSFFDLGGSQTDRNRVQLFVDQQNLVLRAYDDAGDDPDTAFREAGEVRLPLTELSGSSDTWTHLSMSWHGNRPRDLLLMVDGVKRGTTRGLTKLSSSLPDFVPTPTSWPSATIPVESTDGFPDSGVLLIGGTEFVEYTSKTGNSFQTGGTPKAGSTPDSWLSGRKARLGSSFVAQGQNVVPLIPQAVQTPMSHERGEGVELYGYSALLRSNIPFGGASLGQGLGTFSVGRLVTGNAQSQGGAGDPIDWNGYTYGQGIEGNSSRPWILESIDGNAQFMDAFSRNGGYALVFQRVGRQGGAPNPTNEKGFKIAGTEIVHYRGWTNKTLDVDQRGIGSATLKKIANASIWEFNEQPHAFITFWNAPNDGFNDKPCTWIYVVPISVNTGGFSPIQYEANPGDPSLADVVQIYDDSDEGKTEWVRYDEVANGNLVRSDPTGIVAAINSVVVNNFSLDTGGPPTIPQCPIDNTMVGAPKPVPDHIGNNAFTNKNSLVYRFWYDMKHRGVMGTFPQSHKAGSKLIPVFQVTKHGGVRPGRNDRVAVYDGTNNLGPIWKTVNWAHIPNGFDDWANAPTHLDPNRIYVALKEQIGPAAVTQNFPQSNWSEDVRQYSRIVKFPSGELPQEVNRVFVGSSIDGAAPQVDGQVDEVEFLSATAPGAMLTTPSLANYQLLYDLPEAATTLTLAPQTLSVPHGQIGYSTQMLPTLPADAGLLRIDDEILGYIQYDAVSGAVTLAPNGRGMLGTEASAHGLGSPVQFLDHLRTSELTAGLSPYSLTIPVDDPGKFPSEGTLRIENELLHFTYKAGGALLMPGRKMEETDKNYSDREEGLFRGRYGTPAAAHAAGTLAVHYPFRYWDRAPARSDVAELSFFGAHLDAPGGYFQTLFWEEDPSLRDPFVHLEALARVDDWARWDEEPGVAPGLFLFDRPVQDGQQLNRIDRGGNRLELRFFTRYLPGAFDAINHQSHSWKRAPHLRRVAIEYQAPSQLLWRSESRW